MEAGRDQATVATGGESVNVGSPIFQTGYLFKPLPSSPNAALPVVEHHLRDIEHALRDIYTYQQHTGQHLTAVDVERQRRDAAITRLDRRIHTSNLLLVISMFLQIILFLIYLLFR